MPESSQVHTALPTLANLPGTLDGTSGDYQAWRKHRLRLQDQLHDGLNKPFELSPSPDKPADCGLLESLCNNVRDYGYSLYQWTEIPDDISASVDHLHKLLSLTSHDPGVVSNDSGLSLLTDMSGTDRGRFIPYTARAMGWHTDGYYNDQNHTLRCFTLHCISQAASGGALTLMDYELLLIAMMDDDPELIPLLTHPEAMTLPANKDNLGHDRPDRHVSVIFNHADGTPGVRFTTRTKNIQWRTADTQAAAERMAELVNNNPQWNQTIRLLAGQGVITRNILHRREAYVDKPELPPRQMLRGRYLQMPALQ